MSLLLATFVASILSALEPGPDIVVAEIVGPVTIISAEGQEIVLADLYRFAGETADDPGLVWATQRLSELVQDQRLRSAIPSLPTDRYGRQRLHLILEDGRWLQEALLAEGAAVSAPWGGPNAIINGLDQAEQIARQQRLGFWRRRAVNIRVDKLDPSMEGRFVRAMGVVHKVTGTDRGIFLNFGDDYDTDTTVLVPKRSAQSLGGLRQLKQLTGKSVVARGALDWWNGPFLTIDRPGMLYAVPPSPP